MISQLDGTGVRVPGGFATTAHAYREFLKQGGLDDKIYGEAPPAALLGHVNSQLLREQDSAQIAPTRSIVPLDHFLSRSLNTTSIELLVQSLIANPFNHTRSNNSITSSHSHCMLGAHHTLPRDAQVSLTALMSTTCTSSLMLVHPSASGLSRRRFLRT